MPPLPGLRASSLPPAPGYDSDEEGGLCNKDKAFSSVRSRKNEKKERNATIAIANPPVVARQRPRGLRGNRATRSFETPVPPPPLSPSTPSRSRPREKGLFRVQAGQLRYRCSWPVHGTSATIDGGPAAAGPISISIKGGAHVPPPRKCPPHKRSGEDARSLRIDTRAKHREYSPLSARLFNVCSRCDNQPEPEPVRENTHTANCRPRARNTAEYCRGGRGGLPIHRWQPNCSVSVLFVR